MTLAVTLTIDDVSMTLTASHAATVLVLGVDPTSGHTAYVIAAAPAGTTTLPRPLTRRGSVLAVVEATRGTFYGCVVVP